MIKKNLILALAATFCVSCAFAGCSSNDEGNNSNNANTPTTGAIMSTEAKEEADLYGYWTMKNPMDPSSSLYYHFSENKMEAIMMGNVISLDVEITDTTITSTTEGLESEMTYSVDGDKLTLTEDGEDIQLDRITEDDFNAALDSDENENEAENEDPGVNGYVVEPGVTMTVTEDDGTIVVYANDGDGTYIKSTTPPGGATDDDEDGEDETEATTKEETSSSNTLSTTDRHIAFQRNPYLVDVYLPTQISELHKKYGAPTEVNNGYDTWITDDGYTVVAFYEEDGTVWRVEATPDNQVDWFDLDTDIAAIDDTRTYRYEEFVKYIGSPGIVNSIYNAFGKHYYTITWKTKDFNSITVSFDMNTHQSIDILKYFY